VPHQPLERRFDEPFLAFTDPDGLSLALVGVPGAESEPIWTGLRHIPEEHAIRGFQGVALLVERSEPTAAILQDVLGFKDAGRAGSVRRFRANSAIGGVVDLHEAQGFLSGQLGRGSVHHVAFRAPDDATQAEMASRLITDHHQHVTHQLDRKYFRSVYFREPGGILFEIATDDPGFTVDEAVEALGHDLKLPRFLESQRDEIAAALPELHALAQAN